MASSLEALNVIDFATLTVSSTAVGCADATPAYANGKVNGQIVRRMLITSETSETRWRADGTDPSSSEGHIYAKDSTLSFTGANYRMLLKNIRFIATGDDATLKITYFD